MTKFLTGYGMGTLFVLVSPCLRENVVDTYKIGSFLCSLDNLLQKNVIIFFFGNQISKWRSFEKRGYFGPTFHIFLVTREKLQTFLQHIQGESEKSITFWVIFNEKSVLYFGKITSGKCA